MTTVYDLVVLGAGSAGVRASRFAAALGAKVAVVEERFLGGTCVNVGCVPKKLMVYGAHVREEIEDARGYGWDIAEPVHHWARLKERRDAEIARLNGIYQRLLETSGVRIVRGRATLSGRDAVSVVRDDGEREVLRAKHILVATGGRAVRPDIIGAEHAMLSDGVFALTERPKRIVVVGGGYIGVEFAGVFHGYGSTVTLVHRGERFLQGFDQDVRAHLEAEYTKKGIALAFHRDVAAIERNGDGSLSVRLRDVRDASAAQSIEADAVLFAIGRTPNTEGLGLEALGVKTNERGAVLVDQRFRTSVKTLYACGDVIERVQLTPVALAEGMFIARSLFGKESMAHVEYDNIPSAVFSTPPIATVGLTEEEARAEFAAVDVYKSTFRPMKLTMTERAERALMKLVVDRATQRVLGAHVVAPDAGEIVQGFAVALRMGATKAQLDATIGIHPTAAEELVTMRELCPEPDHTIKVTHPPRPPRGRVVHHRWEEED